MVFVNGFESERAYSRREEQEKHRFELELWRWTGRGARAGGLEAYPTLLRALLAERG